MKKKLISLLLALSMCLSFAACGEEEASGSVSETISSPESDTPESDALPSDTEAVSEPAAPVEGSWAVYWYLCGSDLETNHGCATTDLCEMMEVALPENVTAVIQTGGAAVWQNDQMDPGKLQRWVYDSNGLKLVEEKELSSMGDAQTLYEFLDFANTNYPAD